MMERRQLMILKQRCISNQKNVSLVVRFRKELKEAKQQIDKSLKLKGGSEILDVMLSAQKQSKDKDEVGFKKGECSKTPNKEDKGKEKMKDEL